jgi:hypothetical protein
MQYLTMWNQHLGNPVAKRLHQVVQLRSLRARHDLATGKREGETVKDDP